MASFEVFFPTLLKHEGGFVDNPNDPGGATNKGITMGTFRRTAQRYLGIEPTLQNLKDMTDEQAFKIYKPMYWDKISGDAIDNQVMANFTFDFFVNAGANAIRTFQRTYNDTFPSEPALGVDGVVGPITLKALNFVDLQHLYTAYKNARIGYYEGLVARNPKFKVFIRGWINRVDSFPDSVDPLNTIA